MYPGYPQPQYGAQAYASQARQFFFFPFFLSLSAFQTNVVQQEPVQPGRDSSEITAKETEREQKKKKVMLLRLALVLPVWVLLECSLRLLRFKDGSHSIML
jgi:hypothetical protein